MAPKKVDPKDLSRGGYGAEALAALNTPSFEHCNSGIGLPEEHAALLLDDVETRAESLEEDNTPSWMDTMAEADWPDSTDFPFNDEDTKAELPEQRTAPSSEGKDTKADLPEQHDPRSERHTETQAEKYLKSIKRTAVDR